MKLRRSFILGLLSSVLVAQSLMAATATRSRTITSGGTAGAATSASTLNSNPAVSPAPLVLAPPGNRYGWVREKNWLHVPPLPEAHYVVVPLVAASLSLPLGPNQDGSPVPRMLALTDQGGLLYSYFTPASISESGFAFETARWPGPAAGGTAQFYHGASDQAAAQYGLGEWGENWQSSYFFPWWKNAVIPPSQAALPPLVQTSANGWYASFGYPAVTGTSSTTGTFPLMPSTGNSDSSYHPAIQAAVFSPAGVRTLLPLDTSWVPPLLPFVSASPNLPGMQSAASHTLGSADPRWPDRALNGSHASAWTSLSSEAVGVNRLGHVIVRQTGSAGSWSLTFSTVFDGNDPSYDAVTENWSEVRVSAGRLYKPGPSGNLLGQDLLGRVTFTETGTAYREESAPWGSVNDTYSPVFGVSGQTVDPRFLNDEDMVLGYRQATGTSPLLPEAGVLDADGHWWILGMGRVVAGLTSGYTDATGRLVPPVAHGWEQVVVGGQAQMRAWWARGTTVSVSGTGGAVTSTTSWVKAPLLLAETATDKVGQPVQPTKESWPELPGLGSATPPAPPPVWKINRRFEMVFGDDRLARNGRLRSLNAGLLPPGWQVRATRDLGDDGTILAEVVGPPPAATASSPLSLVGYAGPARLIPVEIVGAARQPVERLRVAKMGSGVLPGVPASNPALNLDNDPDRFHVRIPGGVRLGLGAASVRLGTRTGGSLDLPDNTPVEVDLHPEGDDLVSPSLLLVADDIDDDYPVDGVADDAKNDRTFRIRQGGLVQVASVNLGGTDYPLDYRLPGPAERTVEVNIVILRETVGGATVFGAGISDVDAIAKVEAFWRIAQERYAQVGINLDYSIVVRDPPAGVNLADGLLVSAHNTLQTALPPESKALIDALGTKGNPNDIHVFYVKQLRGGTSVDKFAGGLALPEYIFNSLDPDYSYNIFIDGPDSNTSLTRGGYVAAHELGHLLRDARHEGDRDPARVGDRWHLMADGILETPAAPNEILGSRRLNDWDEARINANLHVH